MAALTFRQRLKSLFRLHTLFLKPGYHDVEPFPCFQKIKSENYLRNQIVLATVFKIFKCF